MPSKIVELRQRQHDLKAEGRGLLDTIEAESRELTEDEDTRIKAIESELDTLAADIQKEEQRMERAKKMAVSGGERVIDTVPNQGFGSLAEFAQSVHQACRPGGGSMMDERLYQAAPTNFHQETGATEGYMVPPEFRQAIWELVFGEPDLLNMVDMEPTSSNSVELLVDEDTPWGSSGVQANWRAEGSQMSATKLTTNARQVKLHELYAFVLATDELLQDAPRLNDRLTRKAAEAIRYKASDSIIYATGVGQPLGYFASGALVTQAKESGQAADTVVAKNVAKMYSRVLNPGRSVWIANSDVMPELMTMTIGDQPIWTAPSQGFQQAPGGFLLGRPVMLTEHAKTVGDVGDIQLIDPMGYYATRKQGGINFDTSIHLFFDYGVQAFRWTFRFGGQPYLSAPVSPDNGSNTKSHFVVLAART